MFFLKNLARKGLMFSQKKAAQKGKGLLIVYYRSWQYVILTGNPVISEYFLDGWKDGGASILPSVGK